MINLNGVQMSDPVRYFDKGDFGVLILQPTCSKIKNYSITGLIARGIRSKTLLASSATSSFENTYPHVDIEFILTRDDEVPSVIMIAITSR